MDFNGRQLIIKWDSFNASFYYIIRSNAISNIFFQSFLECVSIANKRNHLRFTIGYLKVIENRIYYVLLMHYPTKNHIFINGTMQELIE